MYCDLNKAALEFADGRQIPVNAVVVVVTLGSPSSSHSAGSSSSSGVSFFLPFLQYLRQYTSMYRKED